jgi:phosphatidylserine/phosphatidylglycerophosphate/cardiolipin synthase-like enzyme
MKFKLAALVIFAGLTLLYVQVKYFSPTICYEGTVMSIFSPQNSEKIFDIIKNSKQEIKLEVYEFSSKPLADALVHARERGVSVKVILEPSVYQNSNMFDYLLNSGIDVSWASKKFHNTHSKFIIIDDEIVFVGSMNWSENALKKNREASVIVYSKEISSEFEKIFDADFGN